MLYFRRGMLNKKHKRQVDGLLFELPDIYRDFYITKDNLRMYIKDNLHIIHKDLKRGNCIAWSEQDGIAYITGYSDKAPRKYIKMLSYSDESTDRLLKVISHNVVEDLYVKIKKNNPIRTILQKNGFVFIGDRGKEILLFRKARNDNFETPNKE